MIGYDYSNVNSAEEQMLVSAFQMFNPFPLRHVHMLLYHIQNDEPFQANNCDSWSLSDLILSVFDNHRLKDFLHHSVGT